MRLVAHRKPVIFIPGDMYQSRTALAKSGGKLVEPVGIEPTTSSLQS
jgi:hypothetical protein